MRRALAKKTKHKPASATAFRGYLRNKAHGAALADSCRTLSGALYAGRGAGEPGGWRASLWIARKVQALGLRAWHGRRSLFQSVPLGCATARPRSDACQAIVQDDGSRYDLLQSDELLIR